MFSVLILAALPGLALAADFRADEGRQEVSGAVDDDVYVAAEEIMVSGDVTGDVFAAGRGVGLTGSTGQSFFAGAQTVTISGMVQHSARVAAQDVEITGTVNQDLLGAGQTVAIGSEGNVGRDVVAGGESLEIAGSVGRNVLGGTSSLTIRGTVGGDVKVESQNITLANGARIGGDLIYTSANEADIDPGAQVAGRVVRREPRQEPDDGNPVVDAILEFLRVVAGAILLGLIILWLLPDLLPALAGTMRRTPLPSLGVGIAGLFVVPIVAFILFILTLIVRAGVSVPVLLIGVYTFLLLLAKVAVGYLLGLMILYRNDVAGQRTFADSLKTLAVGVALLTLVSLIPFIGGLVEFLVAVFALGAGMVAFAQWRKPRAAGGVPPAAPPMPAASADA